MIRVRTPAVVHAPVILALLLGALLPGAAPVRAWNGPAAMQAAPPARKPRWMAYRWYVVAVALFMSWPYHLWLEGETIRVSYTLKKTLTAAVTSPFMSQPPPTYPCPSLDPPPDVDMIPPANPNSGGDLQSY
ncbi:MAG: hypothetical protein ACKOC5_07250, partial [Chloroflexota bacterium]